MFCVVNDAETNVDIKKNNNIQDIIEDPLVRRIERYSLTARKSSVSNVTLRQ
jgi:hypothetical protein